jgi:hypothetical protein
VPFRLPGLRLSCFRSNSLVIQSPSRPLSIKWSFQSPAGPLETLDLRKRNELGSTIARSNMSERGHRAMDLTEIGNSRHALNFGGIQLTHRRERCCHCNIDPDVDRIEVALENVGCCVALISFDFMIASFCHYKGRASA